MFSSGNKEKKYIIFNINSAEVSGALVYFDNERQKPTIEYSVKNIIQISQDTTAEKFKSQSFEALKSVSESILNYLNISEEFTKIDRAFVFLSSPWVRKNIHHLIDERIQPFLITDEFLEEFLENGGQMKESEDLVKAEIISLKANEYQVLLSDLPGKEVTKLDIELLDSYIDQKDKEKISETILEIFPFLDISYSAFLPTLFSQVKKIYDISDDFAFLDFTGEVMEFGIYQDGQVKNIITIQAGKNKIIREFIKEGIAENFSEAEYIFSLYLRDSLEDENKQKVLKIIEKNISEIKEAVNQELSKEQNLFMPQKAFIVSAGDMNYLLEDLSIFKNTYFIGRSFLKTFVECSEEKYFDNFLALETEYIFED